MIPVLNIYPHPQLPLFPKRLLPFSKDGFITIAGMGDVSLMKLTKMKIGDFPPGRREKCISAVTALIHKMFFGKHKEGLSKITLGLPANIKISDLKLNERAQASLGDGPFFKSAGPWRTSSLMEEVNGINPSVGPRLFLALLLAAEAATQKPPANKREPTLEEELHSLVSDVVHSERNATVFLRFHGWDGSGQKSLSIIANQLNLTHERVRQIVRSAEASMRKHSLRTGDLSHLRQAISILASNSPMRCQDGASMLQQHKISAAPFDVQGVLDAAAFFSIPTGMDRWVWEGSAFVRRNDPRNDEMCILMGVGLAQTLSQIHRDIRRHLRHEGALQIDEEAERLKTKHGVSQAAVRFAFQIYASGQFCGPGNSWFVALTNSERARKLHALVRWTGSRPITALIRACDSFQMFASKPPTDVLETLLTSTNLFKIENGRISIFDSHVFDKNEDVRIENTIMAMLNAAGGKMPRRLLRNQLTANGEKGEEIAKQLRSSLLYRIDGKNVKIEAISNDMDTDASFVASLGQGIDFRVFSENMPMEAAANQT